MEGVGIIGVDIIEGIDMSWWDPFEKLDYMHGKKPVSIVDDFDGLFDPNNPVDIDRIAKNDPVAGRLFEWWYNYNEQKDRNRMDSDRSKNTGESWTNSPYSWYSYRHNSYSGSGNGYGTRSLLNAVEEFAPNESIMNLYNKRW